MPSDADDSSVLPPSGVTAQSEADAELEPCFPRQPQHWARVDWLDVWFLGSERDAQPRSTLVPFFTLVHEDISKSWKAPFFTLQAPPSSLPLMVGRRRDIPQVEHPASLSGQSTERSAQG